MEDSETFTITGHINSRLMAEYPLDDNHAVAVECIGRTVDGRTRIHYILFHGTEIIFDGDDIATGVGDDIDYGKIAKTVLVFLTYGIEDSFTEAQIAWYDEFAESLSMYTLDEVEFVGVLASA